MSLGCLRCLEHLGQLLTYRETVDERVTGMLSGAPANWIMISNDALRVLATSIFTGIAASHVHASLALLAIGANETLGSAAWWDSKVTR